MNDELIFSEVNDGIGTIYFNRGNKRNALNYEMWLRIPELVKEFTNNPDVRVIVFRSLDRTAFSAGADISEFKTLRYTAEGADLYNQATLVAERVIMHTPKPTIALIQGFCVGGGCEIALACDFRFSDPNGKFGITPAKLGLVYNLPGTKNLVDLVGPSKAKDILYTGRLLDANEALDIGLIDRVYSSEEVVTKTYEYTKLISQNAQFAVRGSKYVINKVLEGEIEDTEEISQLVLESFETDDYKEGVNAFQNKRKPNFQFS
ncbi:enoyl-CoA hydratase-related protein [Alkalihalobacillus sp. AL-G]|uniref:enoyl-CoA hydratase-related protein n=1 Tax=Alkalihalobacillus sp. AL-G TaxID=2926399 RepID=UPI00272C62CD|nr:enoyl-CoA hydratase-related protein [Alkalihalobacillus sp. AL-G]WLD94396.1 enoyl-CoA hydratase-related protein [Alkalihalobacillus sp. AL-G]